MSWQDLDHNRLMWDRLRLPGFLACLVESLGVTNITPDISYDVSSRLVPTCSGYPKKPPCPNHFSHIPVHSLTGKPGVSSANPCGASAKT
jgi:hypothetical protein